MSMDRYRRGSIRLGDIEYQPETGHLVRDSGEEVFLRAQSAHVLRLLSENAGSLVTKDELISAVWPDVHVTDDSLTQCISDIRRAIGDKTRQILQTVPKRGFVLRVSPGGTTGERASRPDETTPSGAVGIGPDRVCSAAVHCGHSPATASSACGGLDSLAPLSGAVPVLSGWAVQPQQAIGQLFSDRRESGESLLPTIAVIPFGTSRTVPAHDVVGEVVADDVIAALSRSEEVNVISRLSTTVFRWRDLQLGMVGRALNADYVLSGSLAGEPDNVVLRLEFAEVSTNRVLWSDRMEAMVPSLLTDPDVSLKIVSGIRKAIELREIRRVRTNPLASLRSHSLLTGAVGLMHRLSPPDFESARALLTSLIERVPDHPSPLAWMARWHVLRVQQGWSDSPKQDAEAALACAKRALDIDPENALALVSEGFVLTNLLRRLDDAEARYDAALEINPNEANGRLLRGALYAFQGKGERAIRDSELALHLAPLDPHRFFFLALAAGAHLAAENYERALELADGSLRINKAHTSTLRIKAVAHLRLGQAEQAADAARELMRLQPSMRVNSWLKSSPAADFEIGQRIAADLRAAGIPD